MRSYIASAVLAAGFVSMPAAVGYAPALSQDFSITNETRSGDEWFRALQAWWNVHAYYPPGAAAKNQGGDVKVHLVIHPDGEIWEVKVVQGSGDSSIDDASVYAFHYARLRPIPPMPPAPQAEVYLTVHFVPVQAHAAASSKSAFTIMNTPVEGTVVDAMQRRTCTGNVVPDWEPPFPVWAIFDRKPDGTTSVEFYQNGIGPDTYSVTELGVSAQWTGKPPRPAPAFNKRDTPTYAVWPDGDNGLSGVTANPWGTIHLTCK